MADLKNLTPGKNPPEEINVVIEIPEGSLVKYELHKPSGYIVVDRFVRTTMGYPANYGFIPNTMSGDGDPVDVLVLCSQPLLPNTLISCHPIAVLEMEDEAGMDAKVIAVPSEKSDPNWGIYKNLADLPEPVKAKIEHFFNYYKELEKAQGKWVKVKGWKDKTQALEEVKKGMKK
ncbi:inorganic diphosphatase [Candidatus Microgenomates bacterium]|nr:MAG: inorganic diphosphatase [Candidatus Microgenomates bacterium]